MRNRETNRNIHYTMKNVYELVTKHNKYEKYTSDFRPRKLLIANRILATLAD